VARSTHANFFENEPSCAWFVGHFAETGIAFGWTGD
jgi:hypothetical protein